MSLKCAFCDKDGYKPKWFVCPARVYKPNQYLVCEEHQDLNLTYDDVYLNVKRIEEERVNE